MSNNGSDDYVRTPSDELKELRVLAEVPYLAEPGINMWASMDQNARMLRVYQNQTIRSITSTLTYNLFN